MLRKQDGPGAIRVVLIATFRLLPEHPVRSRLLFFLGLIAMRLLTLLFRIVFIASCLTHSNKTIVKSYVTKNIAMTHQKKAMLSERDGPGAIAVVLIATFRLLPEHQVCSALLFSMVSLLCLSYY